MIVDIAVSANEVIGCIYCGASKFNYTVNAFECGCYMNYLMKDGDLDLKINKIKVDKPCTRSTELLEKYRPTTSSKDEKHLCTCDSRMLMWVGCKCGGI